MVYPAFLEDAVRQAVDALAPYVPGRTFNRVAGGSCAQLGGNCIMVGVQWFSCEEAGVCGCTRRGHADAEGTYTHRSDINFTDNWNDPNFQIWLMSHELLHILGVSERGTDTCAPGSTVANVSYPCNVVPTGQAITATSSDGLAVADGTYGRGTLKTCGWK